MTITYATDIKGVLSNKQRFAQMQAAIDTELPFLKKRDGFHDRTISIVGFGPSLLKTWEQIPHPMIATSGAYDFLAGQRERPPDYYVAIDPRQSIVDLLEYPEDETTYLVASVCHPDWWTQLAGFDVQLWHLINDETTLPWIAEHHPAGINSAIGGGSTVGQRAMNVAAALGYRKFNVFGLDFSFEDSRHAGPHNGERQPEVIFNDRLKAYRTTPQWLQAASEMFDFVSTHDVEVTFHGEGLMQHMAATRKKVIV